jgi:hypothetical protein
LLVISIVGEFTGVGFRDLCVSSSFLSSLTSGIGSDLVGAGGSPRAADPVRFDSASGLASTSEIAAAATGNEFATPTTVAALDIPDEPERPPSDFATPVPMAITSSELELPPKRLAVRSLPLSRPLSLSLSLSFSLPPGTYPLDPAIPAPSANADPSGDKLPRGDPGFDCSRSENAGDRVDDLPRLCDNDSRPP